MDHSQPQMLFISVEVAVIVKKLMIIFDAKYGYEAVHCFTDGNPLFDVESDNFWHWHQLQAWLMHFQTRLALIIQITIPRQFAA